jgi:hypothetical protein
VVWKDGRLDIDQLQHRMVSTGRRGWPAGEHPASYMVFDLLALDRSTYAPDLGGNAAPPWKPSQPAGDRRSKSPRTPMIGRSEVSSDAQQHHQVVPSS